MKDPTIQAFRDERYFEILFDVAYNSTYSAFFAHRSQWMPMDIYLQQARCYGSEWQDWLNQGNH